MEGGNAHAGYLRPVQGEASGPHGMPDLRHVCQAAGSRRLIVDGLSASLSRVLGGQAVHVRMDTPLRTLALDPDGWVCLSWAFEGRIRDVDVTSLDTVGDLRRVIA